MATEQEDIEFYKKEISNYEKKIKEKKKKKKIICNYLLEKYLEIKCKKDNENIALYFKEEFHRLLFELKDLEKFLKFLQDHIKIFY